MSRNKAPPSTSPLLPILSSSAPLPFPTVSTARLANQFRRDDSEPIDGDSYDLDRVSKKRKGRRLPLAYPNLLPDEHNVRSKELHR